MYKLLPQIEKQGKEESTVLVKRLKGFVTVKEGKQCFIKVGSLMFQSLIEKEGGNISALPIKITFSQRWVNKEDGSTYQAGTIAEGKRAGEKTKPNPLWYFLRNKITIKREKRSYFKETRTGKQCISKVTQRIRVDEHTSGAKQDENEDWYILVDVIAPQEFDLNNAKGENTWANMARQMIREFGYGVTKTFTTTLLERVNNG